MHIDELPPEILVTAFELGILSEGIQFLLPVCLVCKSWYTIVDQTPMLWGIVEVSKFTSSKRLLAHIARAKAVPLTIFISSNVPRRKGYPEVLNQLMGLSSNWIRATLPSHIFARSPWPNAFGQLEELNLVAGPHATVPSTFLEKTTTARALNLRTLTLTSLSDEWVRPFLSPTIESFTYAVQLYAKVHLADTLDQLSLIPNVKTLKLVHLNHEPRLLHQTRTLTLRALETLELSKFDYPSSLLSSVAAPALQTLVIDGPPRLPWPRWAQYHNPYHPEYSPTLETLAPFFLQWCDPRFIPANLHTLKLVHRLQSTDIPFLIRFLARLPNINRLIIIDIDNAISSNQQRPSSDESDNLCGALASINNGAMLCPALVMLHLEGSSIQAQDLLQIAQTRGVRSMGSSEYDHPKRLRTIMGFLCGEENEGEQIGKLVEFAQCRCLACGLALCGSV